MSVRSINAAYLFNNHYKSDLYRVGRYAVKKGNSNYFFDICHPNEIPDKIPFKCCGTKAKACKNATTANVKITSRKNKAIQKNPAFKGKGEFTLSLREFLRAGGQWNHILTRVVELVLNDLKCECGTSDPLPLLSEVQGDNLVIDKISIDGKFYFAWTADEDRTMIMSGSAFLNMNKRSERLRPNPRYEKATQVEYKSKGYINYKENCQHKVTAKMAEACAGLAQTRECKYTEQGNLK